MADQRASASELEPLARAPRFIFIRMRFGNARIQDKELRRVAAPPNRAENQQAIAISEPEAAAAPTKELIPPCWDHQNASYWLQHTEELRGAPHTSEELRTPPRSY